MRTWNNIKKSLQGAGAAAVFIAGGPFHPWFHSRVKQEVDFSRFKPIYYSQGGNVLHVTLSFDKYGYSAYLEDAKSEAHTDTVVCSENSLAEVLDGLEVNINYLLERGELFTEWGG